MVLGLVGCSVTHEGDSSLYVGYGGASGGAEPQSRPVELTGGGESHEGMGGETMVSSGGALTSSGDSSVGGSGSGTGGEPYDPCGPCHPDNPHCDVERVRCVQCLGDEHCPEDYEVCKESTGLCVFQCTSDEHCKNGKYCLDGACTECSADAHCQDPDLPACNNGRCSECQVGDVRACSGMLQFECATEMELIRDMCDKHEDFSCQGAAPYASCDGTETCADRWGPCLAEDGRGID